MLLPYNWDGEYLLNSNAHDKKGSGADPQPEHHCKHSTPECLQCAKDTSFHQKIKLEFL
ncbi:hypothetical protein T03_9898 [Trichinella britovi]|uniref:Uncharacterized protein n=1 Tax=Trichinella britovi TaxID=45882 RepID=A0A0V1AQU9_TRIBR|nr:hypothetical protein T03_9898 [Trichinella britovi]